MPFPNHATMDILHLLELHHVTNIEVTFCELEIKFLTGPALFTPITDKDCLKDVIDNLSTTLSLPIARMKTLKQGTLGFYFRVRDDFYAITTHHVLFKADHPNVEYNYICKLLSLRMMRGHSDYIYIAGPKKEVVMMGAPAFANYLTSLQKTIDTLCCTVTYLEGHIEILMVLVADDGPHAAKSVEGLPCVKQELTKMQAKIKDHKAYFLKVKKQRSELKDHVIRYVVWSPPISINTPPYSYTKDICVIKLNKKKFCCFGGNVLSLGAC